MHEKTSFGAPWGTLLKSMTVLSFVLLLGIPVISLFYGPRDRTAWILAMQAMPVSILVIGAFFTIRGYALSGNTLLVLRPGWTSKLPLTDLLSAEVDPDAMAKSIRTCGNGGLFCFAGAFWSRKLGSYRAFATDPKHSVILKFSNRTVVVTPDNPVAFVAKIRERTG